METKKFRRIYWVTEQLDSDGRSEVTGVYTSIPDLADQGLCLLPGVVKTAGFRLSLVQLDKPGVLGSWTSPDYSGLEAALDDILASGEIHEHDKELMLGSVRSVVK